MPDAELVTLPIRCPTCGQPVTVFYEPKDDFRTQEWTCPYHGCRRVHTFELKGSVVRVVARYEPPKIH